MKQIRMLPVLLLTGLVVAGCKKDDALTQAGDINLAGCEVPAGLTPAEAEKIGCTTPASAADASD